jgi:hypothetical protein
MLGPHPASQLLAIATFAVVAVACSERSPARASETETASPIAEPGPASALRGHEIVRRGELPFDVTRIERFHCDGTWGGEGGRAQQSGHYTIAGDEVCVRTPGEQFVCRRFRVLERGLISLADDGEEREVRYAIRPMPHAPDHGEACG